MYPRDFFSDNPPAVEYQTCFVVMPFQHEFRAVYDALLEAVAGPEVNFSCRRADELFGGGHIMQDILDSIARAEIIIADLTNRNPNVFYELGIVHTVKERKSVLLLAQSIEDVPFDLRPFRCIVYEDSPPGLRDLTRRIIETIREITPARFRFTISEGESFTFPQRLPGPDRYLYDFEVGSVNIGSDFAKFRMVVRRYGVDTPLEVVSTDTYGMRSGDTVDIPILRWQLNVDRISGDRAHFCVCEPETEAQ